MGIIGIARAAHRRHDRFILRLIQKSKKNLLKTWFHRSLLPCFGEQLIVEKLSAGLPES
jgi:hypothetical protein